MTPSGGDYPFGPWVGSPVGIERRIDRDVASNYQTMSGQRRNRRTFKSCLFLLAVAMATLSPEV